MTKRRGFLTWRRGRRVSEIEVAVPGTAPVGKSSDGLDRGLETAVWGLLERRRSSNTEGKRPTGCPDRAGSLEFRKTHWLHMDNYRIRAENAECSSILPLGWWARPQGESGSLQWPFWAALDHTGPPAERCVCPAEGGLPEPRS